MSTSRSYIKLAILPVFFLLLSGLLHADTREINQVDENGLRQGYWIIKGYMVNDDAFGPNATVEEGNYVNNRKEGLWKKYYPTGILRSEITYKNNRPSGAYAIYYSNGQIEEKSNWVRNKNIGEFKRFYPNGEPQQEFFFADNGKRNGVQKYYYENGQLALEVNIRNGKEEGEMRRYYENGKLSETKVMSGGELNQGSTRTYRGNAPKEPKVSTKPVVNNKEVPPAAKSEAKPNDAFTFEPDGHNILYNASQQITQVGDFRNGRLWDGKWYRYNKDGILVRIEIYKDGKYIGTGVIEEDDTKE